MKLPGVVRLFPSRTSEEVILEVVAVDKRALDELVMSTIQGHPNAAMFTHTFIVIDHLPWQRDPPFPEPSLLITVADVDLSLGMGLSDILETDTGIRCRTYPRLPFDAQPPEPLADVVTKARCHVLMVSKEGLDSVSWKHRFKTVTEHAERSDICCLVLPDCTARDVPMACKQLLCFDANSFLAYPSLLDWIRGRLSGFALRDTSK